MKESTAAHSFIIYTRSYSPEARRKVWNNHRDQASGGSYGRKCHMMPDVESLRIMAWIFTNGNILDSKVSDDMTDTTRNFTHILVNYAYDTSALYYYALENTHSLSVIDTKRKRGIVPDKQPLNRKTGIDLRNEYSAFYFLRLEIEQKLSRFEDILKSENVWYTRNRSYDVAMALISIACSLMVMSKIETGDKLREIMKIVAC